MNALGDRVLAQRQSNHGDDHDLQNNTKTVTRTGVSIDACWKLYSSSASVGTRDASPDRFNIWFALC
jgi:hypothetical protein